MSKTEPHQGTSHTERGVASGNFPLLRSQSLVPFRRENSESRQDEELPQRYEIRETDGDRTLRCKEAPAVGVKLDRSFAFSEADARRLGKRVVLLDGAGQFEPLIDPAAQVYNLDHHNGCQRAFTLATCEQALVMVLKGLELDKGDWHLYANEPDLDTVFAIWVLLNHRRVRELDTRGRDALLPLLRLEGAIDANGSEVAEFCGLPSNLLKRTQAKLDDLFEKEQAVKRDGRWNALDDHQYVLEQLSNIDRLIYRQDDFSDFASVDQEIGHVEIGTDRVAVLVSDPAGIYEVEKRLKQTWGDRLGIIALAKDDRHWTLRRTASFAGIDLADAYAKLNLLDRSVDGRPAAKRWGGSDDIGGSPRPVGTGLSASEIGKVLRLAYRQPRPWEGLKHAGMAVLWTALLGLLSWAGVLAIGRFFEDLPSTLRAPANLAFAGSLLVMGGVALTFSLARRRTYIFGWRRPAGRDWLALIPAILVGSVLGGAWAIPWVAREGGSLPWAVGAIALAALGRELWLRGVVHGRLLLDAPVMTVGGPWFLSRATVVSALLGGLLSVGAVTISLTLVPFAVADWADWVLPGVGALISGLGLGMMRERSLSLWPGVWAQLLGAAAWIGCFLLMSS